MLRALLNVKPGIKMAQPSVAREPSMEEILASIRRIIESNEPASPDAFSAQLPPVYDEEEEEGSPFSAELASPPAHVPPAANQGYGARQPEFSYSERQDAASVSDGADKSMSLADVAARVRAAADRNAALGPQGYAAQRLVEPAPVSHPPFQQERAAAAAATPIRPTDMRPLLNAAQTPSRPQQELPAAPVPASNFARPVAVAPEPQQQAPLWENMALRGAVEPEQPVAAPIPAAVQREPIAEERMSQPMITEEPRRQSEEGGLSLNLISAAAGAQIAQSFGELADLFDGVERPTVEEMAQDMLRPMLKDWLEDNLPTLVERLVREEIERVARGPRR